jgi:hypothetical protein
MRFPDPEKESSMINWDRTPHREKIIHNYTPTKEREFIWQELTEKSHNIIQIDSPPFPWQKVGEYAIGGLTDVGFAENSDLLLVVSSQGRGVFDCITGTRVARDRNDELYWYNIEKHTAMGIGPIEKVEIELAGLDGGSLLSSTFDNWSVEIENRDRYQQHLFLVISESSSAKRFRIGVDSEVRAFGFSPTGQSLVIAISSDLTIFSREIAD